MLLLKRIILTIVNKPSKKGSLEHASLTDEELVKRIIKSNNSFLFGILYDRYSKKVYNKCFGFVKNEEEAKDLTQDLFLKLFIKLSSFKGQSKFSTWLYSLAYNFCVNYIKRNKDKMMSDASDPIEDHDYYLTAADDIDDQELYEMKANKLEQALELIPPEDKVILLLKYQDDVPLKILCQLLDAEESAIKMRLKRAKIKVIEAHKTLK